MYRRQLSDALVQYIQSPERAELRFLLILFGGCGSACCELISSNGYLYLLVYIGKVIAVIDYRWHCYHMAIKTDMLLLSRCRWEHNIMIGRRCMSDVSAGDRRIYCGRRLSLSPLLHGDQSRHNAGCLTWSWEVMAGRNLLRSAMMIMKVLCVVDEKDFLQFASFSPFARMLPAACATYIKIPV
eukprot:scaffold23531_cov67-Skeletonema_dohrnii-CCMP3373.AAC.1